MKTARWIQLALRGKPVSGSTLLAAGLALVTGVNAQAPHTSIEFSLVPPLITESAPPNVMLVMSDDHELYKKAYSDFTDINTDGLVDSSYDDSFTYTGYFDSNFCYSYDTTDGRFEPAADITALIAGSGHACNGAGVAGEWSGNFLNWASMTRMDIVRHVLYGGLRIVDTAAVGATAGVTVLERSFLPEDTHSFAKVFTGQTQRYTPWTQASISICSTTYGAESNAPVLRVANGAWPLWAASEVVQCHYRSENGSSGGDEKPPTSSQPSATTYSYNARVQVCVAGVDFASARCKAYTNNSTGVTTYKPIGLLQRYGDNGLISFGLISGSFSKKIDGGVLRKNIVPLTGNATASLNEVDLNNGTFLNQTPTSAGIINTINRLKINNWSYSSNNYSDCNTFSIPKSDFKSNTVGQSRYCGNWGNPLSEIYLEALRYFTGDDISGAAAGTGVPTTAFNTSDASYIPSLPQLSWTDPLNSDNSCASCSIIVLSTGLNSFDKDGLASVTGLWNEAGSTRMTTTALNTLLDSIGTLEDITNGSYLIGDNGTINDENCTAKTITNFSRARGICPEIGGNEGGYDIAALAYHAFTKDLRSDFQGLQTVNTYSVSLAQNLPSYQLTINNRPVTFVPICKSAPGATKLDQSGWTNCSFVDAKIESQNSNGGRMYVAWEDSLWGNDFDMDGIARIEWCIGTNTAACPGEVPNADYNSGALNNDANGGVASRTGHTYASHFTWKTSGLSANSIQFRVSLPQKAAGNAMKFGISISGVESVASEVRKFTNAPEKVMSSGTYCVENNGNVNNSACDNNTETTGKYVVRFTQGNGEQFFVLGQGGYNIGRLSANSGNRMIFHEPVVYTASNNVTAGKVLQNPLYFTAKYGSFNDIDGDGTPRYNNSTTDRREWDVRNIAGLEIPDGIPDNYYPVTNPQELSDSLSQVFEIIASRISSGTAAAVVANSSTGLGSVYQAYYHPQYVDSTSATITWGGVLHSMFIDDSGRFREDNGVPGTLDDPNTDYVLDIRYDTSVSPNRTRFRRHTQTGSGAGSSLTPFGDWQDLEEIGSIWNARDVLADISQANMVVQRAVNAGTGRFSEDAGAKRYIFTYLDQLGGGAWGDVDSGEVIDFAPSNFDPGAGNNNFRYLGLSNSAEAMNLVRYIRGQDISGWRSRRVDIPGDGTTTQKYWVLGDIVHSSPLVVNPPNGRYDIANGDITYEEFKEQYQRRRQMIYTGGNDGMLHAFNGGIWDAEARTFETQAYDTDADDYTGQSHELGAEMWAYIPMNLLPHLQWLKEPNYPHVYYMDAPPQAFDVNIFPDDDVHPNGWGTILVAGMRLGGGEFHIDLNGDSTKETTMSSAYVVLDITDPERPPTLIAEITHPNMGLTTSMPALIKSRQPSSGSYSSPADNQWLLVFGSGPNDLDDAVTVGDVEPILFAYDLVDRELVTVHSNAQSPDAEPGGFFGDLRATDWDDNYVDDVIYVGTVEGSGAAPTGRMKRIVLDAAADHMGLTDGTAEMSTVLNVSKPITAAPNAIRSQDKNEEWILFGTGRLFTTADNRSKTQQSYYGLKEDIADYATTYVKMFNATNVLVEPEGEIWEGSAGTDVVVDGDVQETFTNLYNAMDDQDGWVHHFAYSAGTDPSERVFNNSLVLGSTLVFTTYTPDVDLCTVEGQGFLYALNFRTGTAEAFGPFGFDAEGYANVSIALGQGAPSAPTAVVRTGDDANVDPSNVGDISIVTGSTTGDTNSTGFTSAPSESSRMSWEQLEILF